MAQKHIHTQTDTDRRKEDASCIAGEREREEILGEKEVDDADALCVYHDDISLLAMYVETWVVFKKRTKSEKE